MWSARLKLGGVEEGVEESVEDEANQDMHTRLLRKRVMAGPRTGRGLGSVLGRGWG